MNQINAVALFRLSVLGPLVNLEQLDRGELQRIVRELALLGWLWMWVRTSRK